MDRAKLAMALTKWVTSDKMSSSDRVSVAGSVRTDHTLSKTSGDNLLEGHSRDEENTWHFSLMMLKTSIWLMSSTVFIVFEVPGPSLAE